MRFCLQTHPLLTPEYLVFGIQNLLESISGDFVCTIAETFAAYRYSRTVITPITISFRIKSYHAVSLKLVFEQTRHVVSVG